ncbi:hypothetical protein [Photobacterium leiognathi]|uniref:hypothetical protein n=1 Tax=Photobacterium leiognathi TaxID=553611 RepID=UPI0030C8CB59
MDGLNKRQVRLCARYLGASKELYLKVPTADLEELNEQVPDEVALGVTYDEIDDFLEGKVISEGSEAKILNRYKKTMFKRRPHLSFCCN